MLSNRLDPPFRTMTQSCVIALLVFTTVATEGQAQTWSQLNPAGVLPAARSQMGYGYDETADRLVVYTGNVGGWFPDDAWVLVNATQPGTASSWQQLSVPGQWPPNRESPGSIYDPTSNELFIHGGWGPQLKDTWVLTNANGLGGTPTWLQLPDGPVSRTAPATAYDQATNRLIVFGGLHNDYYTVLNAWNDVWVLTNANGVGGTPTWIQLNPVGVSPAGRGFAASTYDPASNRLIVHGGRDASAYCLDDLWVLTYANGVGGTPTWIQLNPPFGPLGRDGHRMVYNPSSNKALIYGGATVAGTTLDDVWLLRHADGTTGTPQWTQLVPTGDDPGKNDKYAAGYSPTADAFVAALGVNSNGWYSNQTWLLSDAGLTPDDDPPVCDQASATPNLLWPPNHRLVPVRIAGIADPNGDPLTITVTGITQDEAANGLGDGDTAPDGVLAGSTAQVRAERAGSGDGRVYQVSFTASDGRGGLCSGAVGVGVPHEAKGTPVDSGQGYDSTQP
jgi:hypothetical protein